MKIATALLRSSHQRWVLFALCMWACLHIGAAQTFPSVVDISTIESGANGFLITQGTVSSDNTGYSMHRGDFNGDGWEDVIIGARFADTPSPSGLIENAGRVYFVFGREGTRYASVDLSRLEADGIGFAINGIAANDYLGISVASGDVNGDGLSDALMCYPGAGGSTAAAGSCAVVFGRSNRAQIARSLTSLDGTNGFVVRGQSFISGLPVNIPNFGRSGAVIGDLNGDGFGDVCISAAGDATTTGRVACYYGSTSFKATYNIVDLNGVNGFLVTGTLNEQFGSSLAIGDITYDGCLDLVIGSNTYVSRVRAGLGSVGAVFVLYGKCGSAFPSNIVMENAVISSEAFVIEGQNVGEDFGYQVHTADINGDQATDLIVAAPNSDGQFGNVSKMGAVSVHFGGQNNNNYVAHAGVLLTQPSKGIIIYGSRSSEGLGFSIRSGDMNGDGIQDLITASDVARSSANVRNSGQVVVLYGRCNFTKNVWSSNAIAAAGDGGVNGFVVESSTQNTNIGKFIETINMFGRAGEDLLVSTSSGRTNYYLTGRTSTEVTCAALPSVDPSATPSTTPSPSPTASHSPGTPPPTPSVSPTISITPSSTPSNSATPSHTPSNSVTPSVTPSNSPTPSTTPSNTPSNSPTPSVTPTISVTPSHTPSNSPTPSWTPSGSPTHSPTPSTTPSISASPSTSPTPVPTGAPDIILLENNVSVSLFVFDTRLQPFKGRIPAGVEKFSVRLLVNDLSTPTCIYIRRGLLPTTIDYDFYECTTSVDVVVPTDDEFRKRQEDPCQLIEYFFLVDASTYVTNITITLSYDPGCDGCGGYTDGCGNCNPAGSISECSCEDASYRGYDAEGLDRSLLLSEMQLLRQYVAQTQTLVEKVQTRFATTSDSATPREFDDIIDQTYYYQSLLDDFNPFMTAVRSELQS